MELARVIGITTYPENARGVLNSSDIIDDIFRDYSKYKVACILHDKDNVKPHHEILIYSPSCDLSLDKLRRNYNLSYHHVVAKGQEDSDTRTNERVFIDSLLYLCHLSKNSIIDKNKYKYNPSEIRANFEFMKYFISSEKLTDEEICDEIISYGISVRGNYNDVFEYVRKHHYMKTWRFYRLDIMESIKSYKHSYHLIDKFNDDNVIDYNKRKMV